MRTEYPLNRPARISGLSDVSQKAQVDHLVERTVAHYGTIDSDFPLEIKREGASQLARGKLGQGKANIQLDGRNTNIYLISSER